MEEKNKKINKYTVGTVMEGTVEQLKDYGAFVNIGDGITGLVHISQISDRRLKHPHPLKLPEHQVPYLSNLPAPLHILMQALMPG